MGSVKSSIPDGHPYKLVDEHLWIAATVAKRLYRASGCAVDCKDLEQAGCLALCSLALEYNSDMGCSFKSFVWQRVKTPMIALLRQELKNRKAVSALKQASCTPQEVDLLSERQDPLKLSLEVLTSEQLQVLRGLYYQDPPQSAAHLSRTLGRSPSTIFRMRRDAINTLRNIVA